MVEAPRARVGAANLSARKTSECCQLVSELQHSGGFPPADKEPYRIYSWSLVHVTWLSYIVPICCIFRGVGGWSL